MPVVAGVTMVSGGLPGVVAIEAPFAPTLFAGKFSRKSNFAEKIIYDYARLPQRPQIEAREIFPTAPQG
jgi:hypothetical protein